ncbi:MAG: hypothetical protein DWQ10_01450 [Calditrichaeota bacterium]|nr:MAG: hypothetical protein DWQ10_01450 [Calditrichota bacterium]
MQRLPISEIDTYFVNGNYPIEFLFYYKNALNTTAIRKALRRLTTAFWPLFGLYENGAIIAQNYREDDYFSETKYENTFEAGGDAMALWERYKDVNPAEMHGLFFLHVLQFKNGTALVPKMNHLVGDGYSYFYFLAVLAAMAQNSFVPFKKFAIRHLAMPKLNRTPLQPFQFRNQKIQQSLIYENFRIVNETVAKADVASALDHLNGEHNARVSVNDYLSAMVFQKTYQAQKARHTGQFTLSIPMDVRRYVPQLGAKFFGNGLQFHRLTLERAALNTIATEDLALKIRKSVPVVDSSMYTQYLADLEVKISKSEEHALLPYDPATGCLVTNLTRMPLPKLDFGGGAPSLSFPLTTGKNSAAVFADGDNFLLRLVY